MTEAVLGLSMLAGTGVAIVGLAAAALAPSRATIRLGAFGLSLAPAIFALLLLVAWLAT